MGYMGFGMRKEVYTRKPKEAFKKIKEYRKKETRALKPDKSPKLKSPKDFSRRRFTHLGDFKIYKIIIFFFVFGIISWLIYFEDVYNNYLRNKFESEGLSEYYIEQKQYLEYLKEFVYTHDTNIHSMSAWSNFLTIYVKSTDMENKINFDSIQDYPIWPFGKQSVTIESGALVIEQDGKKQEIPEPWVYRLNISDYKQIPDSFFDYLRLDALEVQSVGHLLKKRNWSLSYKEAVSIGIWSNDFGSYDYILPKDANYTPPDSISADGYTSEYKTGKIQDGVFWRRKIN
jgi:hypothetical protein